MAGTPLRPSFAAVLEKEASVRREGLFSFLILFGGWENSFSNWSQIRQCHAKKKNKGRSIDPDLSVMRAAIFLFFTEADRGATRKPTFEGNGL